jgi:dinuclear metal center YbgI/SA1388 family protein
MKIAEILRQMDSIAPLGLALSWDNVGLLIGQTDWEANKALITLDVTPQAVSEAIQTDCRLIVSHHPLIFKPIKSINNPLYIKLIQHGIAVICLHTNLDVAARNVNHLLAEKLGLQLIEPLSTETGSTSHNITVYCPPEATERIRQAAWQAGAGRYGDYSNCASQSEVTGYFSPGSSSQPYCNGTTGCPELALQFVCDSMYLGAVISAIASAHPYETPLITHHPLQSVNPAYGLGLVGSFGEELSLGDIAEIVKVNLNCPQLKLWLAGHGEEHKVTRIAVCGGSGASVLGIAERKAELFISGDIGYHSFLDSRIPIIDAGHFYTEYPVLCYIEEQLTSLGIACSVLDMSAHEYSRNMQYI